jgi:hypothetical protein
MAQSFQMSEGFKKDVDAFDPFFKEVENYYSAERGMRSSIAERMANGQNGYAIITTEEVKEGSKVLESFVQHKEKLGFKVHVVTESAWGGGVGRDAAHKIRTWLQENHEGLNLLYCFFIGNPHPDTGDLPMVKMGNLMKNTAEELKEYQEKYKVTPEVSADGKLLKNTGRYPTDYYYADLSGEWDHDGDTHLGERADFREGGIDGVWEVLVGRLPYYGEESQYGKLEDVDTILKRTIDYENASDVSWRNNLFYVGGANVRFGLLRTHFLEKNGAGYTFYRHSEGFGYEPDKVKWKGPDVVKAQTGDDKYGMVIYQEHGSPRGMAGMMSNKQAVTLNADYPTYFYLGGCDVARPEYSENVCYALLRGAGIGVRGGTRSVTGIVGTERIRSVAGYERLYFGMSQGEAHWDELSALRLKNGGKPGEIDVTRPISMTNYLMTLYGDPSVVVMPKNLRTSLVLSPNRDLTFRHQSKSSLPLSQTFRVFNNTDQSQKYTVSSVAGLRVNKDAFTLKAHEAIDLEVAFAQQEALPLGKTTYQFKVSNGEKSEQRSMTAEVYPRSILAYHSLDAPRRRVRSFGYRGRSAEERVATFKILEATPDVTYATLVKGTNSGFNIPNPGPESFTFSFRFKYASKVNEGNQPRPIVHLFRAGKTECLEVEVESEVLKVRLNTTRGQNNEEPSVVHLEMPDVVADEWYQMILVFDKADKKATLMVNDREVTAEADFGVNQSVMLDWSRHAMERTSVNVYLDEVYAAGYVVKGNELAHLKRGLILNPTMPKKNSSVNPEKVTLSWEASLPLSKKVQEYVIAVSESPTKFNGRMYKTSSTSLSLEHLKNDTTYYWKLGYRLGGKNYFGEGMQVFSTDRSIQPFVASIHVNPAALGYAVIHDNTYAKSIARFVRQQGTRVPVFFSKLEGPDWLQIHPDGSLFTPFGPPAGSEGDNTFKASVATENGSSIEFDFVVPVRK